MPTTALFGPDVRARRAIKSPPNPLDKATIISIYPKDVEEKKWTIQPGVFVLKAGSEKNPTLLNIGPSSWWRDFDPEQPLFEVVQSSMVVAESVCLDYCNGLLGFKKNFAQPGLFWVPGTYDSIDEVKKATFKELGISGLDLFNKAVAMQNQYWKYLVKLADIGWVKTSGNPLVISDDMRIAASTLGMKDKPWMKDIQLLAMINCPMCGTTCNPEYPMCPNCKAIINKDKAKALGIEFGK